jgi:hypothetical protein
MAIRLMQRGAHRASEGVDQARIGSRLSLSAAWLTTRRELMSMMCSTSTRWLALSVLAGGHQVDDGIGQAGQRRQLHAAVELDQVDVHALGRQKMLARDLGVLGGHADARALAHGGGVVEVGCAPPRSCGSARSSGPAAGTGPGHRAPAARPAGHAQVGAAVLHVGGHVGGAHQHHAHVGPVGARMSLRLFSGSSSTSMPAAAAAAGFRRRCGPWTGRA